MKKVRINGNSLVLFDSIDEMPADRFEDFNRYLMIDSEVGSDMEAVDGHIGRIRVFNEKGDKEAVEREVINLRMSMAFVIQGINPKMFCFYSMLKEINGREVRAVNVEDIERLKEEVNKTGITIGKIKGLISGLKKKSDREIEMFFPDKSSDAGRNEFFVRFKKRLLLLLDGIERGKIERDKIEEIDKGLVMMNKPRIVLGSDGEEVKRQKVFTDNVLVMRRELNVDASKMTVREFLQAGDLLRKKQ